MVSCFVAPKTASSWLVDVDALDRFLSGRWLGVERGGDGTGQKAHHWMLPSLSDVWVPESQDIVWMGATIDELAAVGVWCNSVASVPLILSDEGYSSPIDLLGLDEASVVEELNAS